MPAVPLHTQAYRQTCSGFSLSRRCTHTLTLELTPRRLTQLGRNCSKGITIFAALVTMTPDPGQGPALLMPTAVRAVVVPPVASGASVQLHLPLTLRRRQLPPNMAVLLLHRRECGCAYEWARRGGDLPCSRKWLFQMSARGRGALFRSPHKGKGSPLPITTQGEGEPSSDHHTRCLCAGGRWTSLLLRSPSPVRRGSPHNTQSLCVYVCVCVDLGVCVCVCAGDTLLARILKLGCKQGSGVQHGGRVVTPSRC